MQLTDKVLALNMGIPIPTLAEYQAQQAAVIKDITEDRIEKNISVDEMAFIRYWNKHRKIPEAKSALE